MSYTIRREEHSIGDMRGEAATIHEALDAAWALQRHFESPVVVVDDEQKRIVARVAVEWVDQ